MLTNSLVAAQGVPKPAIQTPDSVSVSKIKGLDSIPNKKPVIAVKDSVNNDSITKPKGLLDGIINYKAKDITSVNQKKKQIYLYNEAQVQYQDMDIQSGVITIDYANDLVYAGRIKDSLGNYSQPPVFKQGSDIVEPDSIVFNMKTKKALIWNSKTEQQGGRIISKLTKKENDSVYFVKRAKFTTSENEENPEYYFLLRKAKVVPGKKIVTGLTNMFIADVPTPIGLPFAFFPLSKKRTSGVIFPSFGEQNNRGYFLQNGGYYFALSDYIDLATLGDYYTNGSYGLRLESNYALRYKFRGTLSFRYENLINSERGFPDYSKSVIYNLRWNQNQDSKSNPSSRFSASVNLGSSTYYQESINQLNSSNFLNNTLASSVSYSKTFQGEPQVNLSVTATHSQNTNTETINMTLPTFQGSVDRVFPFAPKTGSKKGVFQNINFQYNVRGENRIQTTDSLFFKKEMFEDAKAGVKHSIPVSTNFKLFKYFSMSTSANFDHNWTFKTIEKEYDTDNEEVVVTPVKGFDSFTTYNFSTSLGTTIYGLFDFGEDKKIQAIRHVVRPSISYNISPAFNQYYDTYEVVSADGLTTDQVEYSRFEQSLFGAPGNRFSSSIGLSLSNNVEAKVRAKDSTATEPKKIFLLNSLNFSTNYNIAADSLNFSPVRMSGGTQLFDNKMSVNFGATLDPYALDNTNRKINEFNVNNGGSLFRISSANFTMSYNLSNDSFGRDSDENDAAKNESLRSGGRADDLFGKPQDFADRRLNNSNKSDEEAKPTDLYKYKIPWSLRLAYALNYNNSRRQNEISSHSLMFSGDIELSPRWSVGASSGYDFKNNGFTYTQLRFERDLESWRMNFSWIPFSSRSSWNFFIGIRSSILSDLKYDKQRQRDKTL
ncbi:putative LPS assembly protein LptD [Flavobacteriaceae bacterium]|uniref:putative LPS assembly protein LptD n=1 Tax=Formosa sp. Hel3_A1_48 TaxID=1336795 RepID=UPI001E5C0998|nr:putative LPS assembly protein LptD [Formosa sp. Hel3_A1_48]MDC0950244.1 putative LPS assembly protein LptD [Flavobacteriaceae bacterium]